MVFKPSDNLSLDCYADADFAGLFKYENLQDPRSARSRTGFLITLGGSPVVWASRMQTEVATSTCEAEYIALSTAMRQLLPLKRHFERINRAFAGGSK